MSHILINLDYELYFGKNYYSDNKVIFETTSSINKLLSKDTDDAYKNLQQFIIYINKDYECYDFITFRDISNYTEEKNEYY